MVLLHCSATGAGELGNAKKYRNYSSDGMCLLEIVWNVVLRTLLSIRRTVWTEERRHPSG